MRSQIIHLSLCIATLLKKFLHEFILYVFLVVISPIFSQNNQTRYITKHYGIKEGLSANYITTVLSDHQNIKWIATENGITKYNGSEFDYIRLDKKYAELKNENIETLFLDHGNNLWIGTRGGGVSVLSIEKNSIKNYNYLIDPFNKSDQRILSITEDNQKNIWIGTWGNGIFVINPKTNTLIRHFTTTCLVYTILKDTYGNMWFGNYNILTKYDPIHQKVTEFPLNTEITDLINDPVRNKIWIGTAINPSTNIYSFDHNTQKIESLKTGIETSFARYLAMNQEGELLIGTWSNGLYIGDPDLKDFSKLDIQKNDTRKDNINYDTVIDIHIDKNNIIWLSMAFGGGVIQMIPKKGFKNAYNDIKNPSIQRDCNIQSIYKDSEKIWVGTLENGVFMGDDFSTLENIETKDHKKAIYRHKNEVFIGYEEGFIIYDAKNRNEIFRSPTIERVTSFLIDNKERLWIGTEHDGVAMVPRKSIKESNKYRYFHDGGIGNFRLNNTDRITDIKSDNTGNIWVGTQNGFHIFNENSQSFLHHTTLIDKEIPSAIVNSIHFSNDIAWIGTANGLLKLSLKKNKLTLLKKYTKEDGLNSNFISAITNDDNGNLWLSTATEIVKFIQNKELFINYGTSDGIETSSFNQKAVFNDHNNQIYFGGIDNVTYFDPKKIRDTQIIPEIVISKTIIDNQHVTPGHILNGRVVLNKNINSTNEIILTHKEKSILINYGLNDYLGELNVKYKYKLEGFQEDWIDQKNRNQINFTGLPSGSYTLKIIGSRDNQEWSSAKIIRIKIKAAPWLSVWAFIIYAVAFLSFILFLVQVKFKQSKLKNILEISKIEKQKEVELTEAKLNFFTNISHEFRTPLTLIISPLIEIIENNNLDGSLKKKLDVMKSNANRLLNLVNQLLRFRKADTGALELNVSEGDFISFAYNMFSYFKDLAISKNINYSFESDRDHISFLFDRDNMEIVLSNLLSNAFKNTESGDQILLKINTQKDKCILIIEDTGIGIPEDKIDKIFDRFYQISTSETAEIVGSGIGLAFTKKIIELHSGSIHVSSTINEGTRFTVTLLMNNEYSKPFDENGINKDSSYIEIENGIESSDTLLEGKAEKDISETTILLVDDNEDIRNYLKDLLLPHYNILEAENGITGVQIALEEIPDIIISDIMMPKKDGISLCKELKSQVITSHIPIIFLTAKSSVTSEIEGLQIGVNDYITKPFNPFIIKAKIATLLDNRKKMQLYLQNKIRFEPKKDSIEINDNENQFINDAIKLIEENLQNSEFGIPTMTKELMMSQSSLYRKIKSLTGLSLSAFIRSVRLKNSARLIMSTDAKLNQIAYEVGFNDYKYFKKSFKEHFNCLPSEYKKQNNNKHNH